MIRAAASSSFPALGSFHSAGPLTGDIGEKSPMRKTIGSQPKMLGELLSKDLTIFALIVDGTHLCFFMISEAAPIQMIYTSPLRQHH